jgi:hypothetical protein
MTILKLWIEGICSILAVAAPTFEKLEVRTLHDYHFKTRGYLVQCSRKAPGVRCDPYAAKCPACVTCDGCKACVKEHNRCSVCRDKARKDVPLLPKKPE